MTQVKLPLGVTVSGKADGVEGRARDAARAWGLPYVERRHKEAIWKLLATQARALLAFGADGLALWDGEGTLRFTPGMARLRLKRIEAGREEDTLVRLGELREGDAVLDATLGLAGDALVCARVVGSKGRVVGVEKSFALWALVSTGLDGFDYGPSSARIEVLRGDALEVLRAQPDGAFDVVLFDPMFDSPKAASPAFEVLRRFADPSPLSAEALAEARRVARRWVLVKGPKRSKEFARLGLSPEPGSRFSPLQWARLSPAPAGRGPG